MAQISSDHMGTPSTPPTDMHIAGTRRIKVLGTSGYVPYGFTLVRPQLTPLRSASPFRFRISCRTTHSRVYQLISHYPAPSTLTSTPHSPWYTCILPTTPSPRCPELSNLADDPQTVPSPRRTQFPEPNRNRQVPVRQGTLAGA